MVPGCSAVGLGERVRPFCEEPGILNFAPGGVGSIWLGSRTGTPGLVASGRPRGRMEVDFLDFVAIGSFLENRDAQRPGIHGAGARMLSLPATIMSPFWFGLRSPRLLPTQVGGAPWQL